MGFALHACDVVQPARSFAPQYSRMAGADQAVAARSRSTAWLYNHLSYAMRRSPNALQRFAYSFTVLLRCFVMAMLSGSSGLGRSPRRCSGPMESDLSCERALALFEKAR